MNNMKAIKIRQQQTSVILLFSFLTGPYCQFSGTLYSFSSDLTRASLHPSVQFDIYSLHLRHLNSKK